MHLSSTKHLHHARLSVSRLHLYLPFLLLILDHGCLCWTISLLWEFTKSHKEALQAAVTQQLFPPFLCADAIN